jgi:hypothetical protein
VRSITTTTDAVSTSKTRTVTCLKSSPARTAAADGIHEIRQAAAKQVNTVSTADGLRSAGRGQCCGRIRNQPRRQLPERPHWVKMRKSRNEHMSAGLPPISDIARRGRHGNARRANDAQATRRPAKFHRGNDGLSVVTIEFPRFALSTEIQTSSGPTPVDPLIAHDQADPGARDLWIGQIDILPNQPRALAMCINQPSARSIVPVE